MGKPLKNYGLFFIRKTLFKIPQLSDLINIQAANQKLKMIRLVIEELKPILYPYLLDFFLEKKKKIQNKSSPTIKTSKRTKIIRIKKIKQEN